MLVLTYKMLREMMKANPKTEFTFKHTLKSGINFFPKGRLCWLHTGCTGKRILQVILSTGIDRDGDTIQVLIKQNPTSENFPRISVCGVFVIKLDEWFKEIPSVVKKHK